MDILIREEQETDYSAVEALTREAFWNHHSPGCDEHYLAHILRRSPSFIKALDYVALCDGRVVGNIMYTNALIHGDDGCQHSVLCFGPLSVLPEYQGKGIGSKLVEHTKRIARALGYTAIVIFGDPEFYKRVGFAEAESYGIATAWDAYATPLLACELVKGALSGLSGRFVEDEAYNLDKAAAEAFDLGFPPKEKLSGLPSQQRFSELVAMNRPRKP